MAKRVLFIIKSFVSIILFVLIFKFFKIDFMQLKSLRINNLFYLLLGLFFAAMNIGFEFLRYYLLIRTLKNPPSLKEIITSHFIGYSLGFVTPGSLGTLGKGFFFQNHGKTSPSAIVTLDRIISMLSTYFAGMISLLALFIILKLDLPVSSTVVNVSIIIFSLVYIFFIFRPVWIINKIKGFLPAQSRWQEIAENFGKTLSDIPGNVILGAIGISLIWIFIMSLEYHFILSAFHPVSFRYSMIFIPLMLMLKLLAPVTLGDLGLREGILVFLFSKLSIAPPLILGASLVVFLMNVVSPAVLGLIFLKSYHVD